MDGPVHHWRGTCPTRNRPIEQLLFLRRQPKPISLRARAERYFGRCLQLARRRSRRWRRRRRCRRWIAFGPESSWRYRLDAIEHRLDIDRHCNTYK